jgi:hypothetical protein
LTAIDVFLNGNLMGFLTAIFCAFEWQFEVILQGNFFISILGGGSLTIPY